MLKLTSCHYPHKLVQLEKVMQQIMKLKSFIEMTSSVHVQSIVSLQMNRCPSDITSYRNE